MKKRTSQVLAELRTLAGQASANLYRRIALACEVMADLDWIATVHGGSDLKAADALQDEYFRDLGGYVSLGKLIAMYRHVTEDRWREVKYDVAAVEVIYDEATVAAKEKCERTSWKKVAEERGQKIAELERQVTQLLEAIGTKCDASPAVLAATAGRPVGAVDDWNEM